MSRRRAWLAVAGLAACAPTEPKPATPPPPPASASTEASAPASSSAPPAASSSAAPAPPRPKAIAGSDAARVAELVPLARAVLDTFDNVEPQPVVRGFTQETWVQWRTDKRTPGVFRWVEASTMDLHHAPHPADPVEPCKKPLAPGATVEGGPTMRATLQRGKDGDTLLVTSWRKKDRKAALPKGRSHGACFGPDGTRVWIAWSTPEAPPEVFSVGLDSGEARALRKDARPALSILPPLTVTTDDASVTLSPKGTPKARVVLVEDGPFLGWSRTARFFAAAGIAVRRGGAPRDDDALVEVKGPTGPFVLTRGGEKIVLAAEDQDDAVVPEGDDTRARAAAALGQIADRLLADPSAPRAP